MVYRLVSNRFQDVGKRIIFSTLSNGQNAFVKLAPDQWATGQRNCFSLTDNRTHWVDLDKEVYFLERETK